MNVNMPDPYQRGKTLNSTRILEVIRSHFATAYPLEAAPIAASVRL